MSDSTPRLQIPELVSMQDANEVTWNEALVQLDAFVDLFLLGQFINAPPSSPSDGDAYLLGGAPTGAWSGYAYKIASCIDGAWRFYTPFNGLRAYVATTSAFIVYLSGTWTDWNSLISTNEVSIASATTCDLGAAGSLFVAVTGTTTITSFGTAANKLRFVRFAGALTLTHNATSLILLGGASRTTAAGDVAIYASDGSGNWRERGYHRAASDPGDYATKTGTETLTNKTLGATSFPGGKIDASGNFAIGTTAANGQVNIASAATGIGAAGIVNISATSNTNNMNLFNAFAPNVSNGYEVWLNWGVGAAAENAASIGFYYAANGSASNRLDFALWGSPAALSMLPSGWVGISGVSAPNAALDVGGNIFPHTDNSYNLGSASYRFATVYAGTGSINTSDETEKRWRGALSDAEIAAGTEMFSQIGGFQFLAAIATKGQDGARLHVGVRAQRIKTILIVMVWLRRTMRSSVSMRARRRRNSPPQIAGESRLMNPPISSWP